MSAVNMVILIIPRELTDGYGLFLREAGLRSTFSFPCEGTAGFGDSLNDLEMLQAVRIKVAAVYAPEEVRAAADYLFEDPDQGGLARVLRKIEEDETVDRT